MGVCETVTQAKTQTESQQQHQAPLKSEVKSENGIGNRISEVIFNDHKPVPLDLINRTSKSICKIMIKINNSDIKGTGFFMKINDNKKYLVTNYHVISPYNINNNIVLELYNHKPIKLNTDNREIKYLEKPKDITIIEIKNDDEIYDDIEFLDYDLNYKKGYKIYQNAYVFSIGYPYGKAAAYSIGQITNLNEYEFEHNISTTIGSSGCPILLLNDNINSIEVIGIHKGEDESKKINYGTFIGELFNENN